MKSFTAVILAAAALASARAVSPKFSQEWSATVRAAARWSDAPPQPLP